MYNVPLVSEGGAVVQRMMGLGLDSSNEPGSDYNGMDIYRTDSPSILPYGQGAREYPDMDMEMPESVNGGAYYGHPSH
jgi:hypothetical protein